MRYVALLLLCLPSLALANVGRCSGASGDPLVFPEDGLTGYRRYSYSTDTLGNCMDVDLTCSAEFPNNELLRGRTWYITENRRFDGRTYDSNSIQLYNIQCPPGTFLHLFPQHLRTEPPPTGSDDCTGADFVRVINPELFNGQEIMCGGDDNRRQTDLYNGGLGLVFTNGNASIEFCTDGDSGFVQDTMQNPTLENPIMTGFVIRATCVDPLRQINPGCVDYGFIRDWDPEWLALQNDPYPKPQTLSVPHKRSVENKMESATQNAKIFRKAPKEERRTNRLFKRFLAQQKIDLTAGQSVTYQNGQFMVDFNDGSPIFIPPGFYFCTFTESDFFGSRRFFGSAPDNFVFRGPGCLELDGSIAYLFYSVNVSSSIELSSALLPGAEVIQRVNRIHEYIYDCWIAPYPVVQDFPPQVPAVFPLPRGDKANSDIEGSRQMIKQQTNSELAVFGRVKETRHLGFLQEGFWPIDNLGFDQSCYRGTLLRAAPVAKDTVPRVLRDFCQLFFNACDILLRIACMELINLDPVGAQG